ncbi:MAG: biotin/lipoyl-containing protein [Planctomycetota bacterium]
MPKDVPVTVPMVGKIVKVLVNVGDVVKEEDEVATFEAMKMEMPLVSPVAGKVKQVDAQAGQLVEAETVIMIIETE